MESEKIYSPDITLATKPSGRDESERDEPKYKFGDKVRFRDKNTGQILEQAVVGVDRDQLRVMERRPDGTPGPIRTVPLESVIHEADEQADEDDEQSAA